MSALPPSSMRDMLAGHDRARPEPNALPALAVAWDDLHLQADVLGAKAQLAPERAQVDAAQFARLLDCAPDHRRTLVTQQLADVAAMTASGMVALGVIEARGQDPSAPALALWREIHAARAALLVLVRTPQPAPA